MSKRLSAHVSTRVPAPSLPSPNSVLPMVTVDIRVFWPMGMGNEGIAIDALLSAANDVRHQILEHTPRQEAPSPAHTLEHKLGTNQYHCSHKDCAWTTIVGQLDDDEVAQVKHLNDHFATH